MKEKNPNYGGARPGAGRKSEGKIMVSYKLAPDVVQFLKSQDRPASQIIEEAVRKVNMV